MPVNFQYRVVAIAAASSLVAACIPASGRPGGSPPPARVIDTPPAVPTPPPPSRPARPSRPQPPASLLNAVQALGSSFRGEVGISIRDIDQGWTVSWNGERLLPQQSVSKLWVGVAVMDAVDKGNLSLADPVIVRRSDLTVFHQPIRAQIGTDGYRTTIGTLLDCAMIRSDNTCNDVLLWKVGGPPAIRRMLTDKGVEKVGFGPGERLLQAQTAGLTWKPEWAGGWGFLQARAAMTYDARKRALDRYLADPMDGASANGITLGLTLLEQEKLLSRDSTRYLIGVMRRSRTGPLRLNSGLPTGWTLAHKTGTGQDLGNLSTGYNDVGLIDGPGGRRYAVAVMIASTRQPIPDRMQLMGNVSRAIVSAAND